MMENFFGIMKTELLYPGNYTSAEIFKKDLVDYIEYYNNRRSHQGIAHQIPMERYKNAA